MSMKPSKEALVAATVPQALTSGGTGRPYLLLHGGAGSASMADLAAALAMQHHVVAPVHPGFDDEPRPTWVGSIGDLATLYLTLIERLGLEDVIIVGNSAGGWIAAEMALRRSPRIAALVLMNAVGLDPSPEGGSVVDPIKLGPQAAAYAFHDPKRFGTPPDPAAADRIRRNQGVLQVYAGDPYMHDPTLRARLPEMSVPSLVLWGESDRIVTPAYGRQFATLIPGAIFEPVAKAGHFPQIEQIESVTRSIVVFSEALSHAGERA